MDGWMDGWMVYCIINGLTITILWVNDDDMIKFIIHSGVLRI